MRNTLVSAAILLVLGLAATLLVHTPVRQGIAAEPEIEFHRDIVFGQGGARELTLNLARPSGLEEAVPAIVVVHGGGWRAGRKEQHDDLARFLAKEGLVAATVMYRLAPRSPWPAQIEDVKCAVRWMRAHAERWRIDPERIAAVGFSAGAHLSMLLGTMGPDDGLEGSGGHAEHSSKVQAVVSFFGPTDLDLTTKGARAEKLSPKRLREEVGGRILGGLLGAEFRKDPKLASPIHYVSRGDAPMLLVQGTRDPLVSYDQATKMMEAMTAARVEGKAHFLVGLGHGWGDPHLTETLELSLRFINRQLRPDCCHSLLPRLRGR